MSSHDYLNEEEHIFGLSVYKFLEKSSFDLGVERGMVRWQAAVKEKGIAGSSEVTTWTQPWKQWSVEGCWGKNIVKIEGE